MQNKEMIDKLRDNAELAWASYGYFHLANPNYDFNKNEIDKKRLEEFRKINNKVIFPTTSDILNIKYKYFRDKKTGKLKNGLLDDKLFGGEFTPTQAKRFFEKYDLLEHQHNTNSGFSATLFGEKRKQTNTESKEKSYTNQYGYVNYILAIHGTEFKESIK